MKTISTMIALALLLSGCGIFYDAPRADKAIGKAQTATWDKQIAVQDYHYADKTPEGMSGTAAENAMDVYLNSFKEKTSKQDIIAEGFKISGD